MHPKRQETETQYDLFKIVLSDLLNPRHELVLLAGNIDWQALDNAFGEFFTDGKGAPALPTRLIAGLHYLKHAFGHSDEEVVALWVENPYWQHLCGERFFQHRPPCHPTSLTKWRNRIGEAILCGAGHNIRLILRQLRIFLSWLWQALSGGFAVEINLLANKPA